MLSNNSLLLSSKSFPTDRADLHPQHIDQHDTYYPPSPPLSTSIASSHSPMSKTHSLLNSWSSSNTNKDYSNSGFLNLEKVIQNYASQPELLELILASKVEEDRRRSEEAKLRRKEIDYMLQKKGAEDLPQGRPKPFNQNLPSPRFEHNEKPSVLATLPPITPSNRHKTRVDSFSSSSSIDSNLPKMTHSFLKAYQAPSEVSQQSSFSVEWKQQQTSSSNSDYIKTQLSSKRRNSSSIEMLLSPLPNPMDRKLPELSINSATAPSDSLPNYSLDYRLSYSGTEENNDSAGSDRSLSADNGSNKRRRREMQAINTIIETKEYPYNDDYLWKNNGNTVHKKSGFKSIYYKCSNSSKGCPVNKTVTFKDNGEHLIKYRGQHLPECNRIKRIIDLNK